MADKFVSKYTSDEIEGMLDKANNLQNYSTEEQVIGTWIDGKPLYQKTFENTVTETDFSVHVKFADISNLNIDTLVYLNGVTNNHQDNSCIAVPIPYNCMDNDKRVFYIRKFVQNGLDACIYTRGTAKGTLAVTIQYTKTTD